MRIKTKKGEKKTVGENRSIKGAGVSMIARRLFHSLALLDP